MSTMPNRRKEDVPVWLWRLQAAEEQSLESRPRSDIWAHAGVDPWSRGAAGADVGDADHALVVEREGGERILFLGNRVRPLVSPEPPRRPLPWLEGEEGGASEGGSRTDAPLPDAEAREVAEEVLHWRDERDLQRRRVAMAKSFVVLTERLHRCRKREEVLDAVTELAHQVLEASASLLYLQSPSGDGVLAPRGGGELEVETDLLPSVPAPVLEGLCTPLIVHRETLNDGGEPELASLGSLFDAPIAAASLAVVGVGRFGLLVLVERRQRRAFDDEDLFFLRSIARTAEERMRRLPPPVSP